MQKFKILIIIFVLICLTALGTYGYSVIEGWNFHDSLYMTIITLTTTGFQEVHPLSEAGRNLTMLLLILGMGLVAYSISIIMSLLLSIDLINNQKKKMAKEIKKMNHHTIVCGFGRMGKIVADELKKANHPFLIIEKDPQKILHLKETDYLWIEGDATHDEVLHNAKILDAKTLVSMIDSDSDALYLALAARSLNAKLEIIVRASEEEAKPKILRAGANKVVLPVLMSGMKVAQAILNPAIEDLIDFSEIKHSLKNEMYQLVDIPISKKSFLCSREIQQNDLQNHGIVVIGIKNEKEGFLFSPSGKYKYNPGDIVLTLCSKDSYQKAAQALEI